MPLPSDRLPGGCLFRWVDQMWREEALIMGVGDDGDDLGDVEVALLVGKDADVLVDPEDPGLVVAGDEVV